MNTHSVPAPLHSYEGPPHPLQVGGSGWVGLGVPVVFSSCLRTPKDHVNIRILQHMISGVLLIVELEPECEILVFL